MRNNLKLLKVDTVLEAVNKLNENFEHIKSETEKVSILKAVGRYLACDINSSTDIPNFNRSVVDGYAVLSSDTFGVSDSVPVFLDVLGAVEMGKAYSGVVQAGTAVYVPTGGIIPCGADAVVMVEYTEKLDEKTIAVYKPVAPKGGLTEIGDDIQHGELLFKKGHRVKTKDVGTLAAIGQKDILVYRKPKVTILSTGDEIVGVDKEPQVGQVRDINTYALAAFCEKLGCEVVCTKIVNDVFENFREEVLNGVQNSDIVILSGSSSAGDKDMTADVLETIEENSVFTHGIAIKPGKPTILANVFKSPVFGLPGHPVSAVVVFNVIVAPFIMEKFFNCTNQTSSILAKIKTNLHAGQGRETYQMVTLEKTEAGYEATPIFAKSGAISQLVRADGYIKIDSLKEGLVSGEMVEVFKL